MKLCDIAAEIESFKHQKFFGAVDVCKIDEASRELGVPFPPQYREFLASLGSGGVESEEFIGLGGPPHLDVVRLTRTLRNKPGKMFSRELVPVRADGFGNYDCIDTSQPTFDGEYAIVEWLHDAGGQKGRTLATSYFEWFSSILQMIREIEL